MSYSIMEHLGAKQGTNVHTEAPKCKQGTEVHNRAQMCN